MKQSVRAFRVCYGLIMLTEYNEAVGAENWLDVFDRAMLFWKLVHSIFILQSPPPCLEQIFSTTVLDRIQATTTTSAQQQQCGTDRVIRQPRSIRSTMTKLRSASADRAAPIRKPAVIRAGMHNKLPAPAPIMLAPTARHILVITHGGFIKEFCNFAQKRSNANLAPNNARNTSVWTILYNRENSSRPFKMLCENDVQHLMGEKLFQTHDPQPSSQPEVEGIVLPSFTDWRLSL